MAQTHASECGRKRQERKLPSEERELYDETEVWQPRSVDARSQHRSSGGARGLMVVEIRPDIARVVKREERREEKSDFGGEVGHREVMR